MTNWILTVNRPEYLEKSELLVPKDKVAELVTGILGNQADWREGDTITIEPSNMEYFDG